MHRIDDAEDRRRGFSSHPLTNVNELHHNGEKRPGSGGSRGAADEQAG
jgi:hypothetical protein